MIIKIHDYKGNKEMNVPSNGKTFFELLSLVFHFKMERKALECDSLFIMYVYFNSLTLYWNPTCCWLSFWLSTNFLSNLLFTMNMQLSHTQPPQAGGSVDVKCSYHVI